MGWGTLEEPSLGLGKRQLRHNALSHLTVPKGKGLCAPRGACRDMEPAATRLTAPPEAAPWGLPR